MFNGTTTMDFQEVYQDTCSTVAVAARHGNIGALKDMLADGKPYDVRDNRGWSCIHEAASNGHVECLNVLLQLDDVNVDGRTFEWESALMLASGNGRTDCVNCLIEAGADPNSTTHDMDSPLCRATKENHLDCVKALLDHGAHVNQSYFTGDTPLHMAVSCHGNIDIMSCLIHAGADILATNEHQLTPLFLAAQFGRRDSLKLLIDSALIQDEDVVQTYINMAAYDEATPLYVAAQSGYSDCIEILLRYDADPLQGPQEAESHDDNWHLTIYPIQAAICSNSLRSVRLLSDCLDVVLKQYDYTEMVSDDFTYHPFILAQQQDNYRILLTMLDRLKDNIHRGFGNIFNHDITLNAAIIYMKFEKNWFIKNYRKFFMKYKSLSSVEICVMTLKYAKDNSVLREALHKGRQPEIHISSRKNDEGFFALMKYFYGYCCDGESCSWCVLDIKVSWLTGLHYLMRLCLTPYVSSRNAIRDDQFEEHLEKFQMKLFKGVESQEEYRSMKDSISSMLVSNSLQHNCRIAIVFQLAKTNNYNPKAIDSLGMPDLLKNYIKYTEYGAVGQGILNGFQALDSLEKGIDKVFEKVSNEMSKLTVGSKGDFES